MAGRWRLGVALLLPPDVAAEVDGLRRACGDGALDRVPPHITLVPPVNVREDDVPAAVAVLRSAAGRAAPLELTIGPAATFLPDTPVLYLTVGGDLDGLRTLRDRVFTVPLARPLTWSFVPHVTIADEMAPERIAGATAALADYRVDVELDGVVLLREGGARRWEPIADVGFGPPIVVARGGLPVELRVAEIGEPEASALLAQEPLPPPAGARSFIVTARRDDLLLGAARGWRRGGEVHVERVAVSDAAGLEDVERHLRRVAADLAG